MSTYPVVINVRENNTAGALRLKSVFVITGMHTTGKTYPAAGENRLGIHNTCYLECLDKQCRSPAAGYRQPGRLDEYISRSYKCA